MIIWHYMAYFLEIIARLRMLCHPQLRLPPFRAPPANFLNLIDIIVRAALLACNLKEKKPISIWEVLGVIGGGIALLSLIPQDKNLNLSKLVERVFGLYYQEDYRQIKRLAIVLVNWNQSQLFPMT